MVTVSASIQMATGFCAWSEKYGFLKEVTIRELCTRGCVLCAMRSVLF
jgi:hypothetical protein